MVLAGLGDSAAGLGEPRARAAAGNPAASSDSLTPSRRFRQSLRVRVRVRVLERLICVFARCCTCIGGFGGSGAGVAEGRFKHPLHGRQKSMASVQAEKRSNRVQGSRVYVSGPRSATLVVCLLSSQKNKGGYFRQYWCAHSSLNDLLSPGTPNIPRGLGSIISSRDARHSTEGKRDLEPPAVRQYSNYKRTCVWGEQDSSLPLGLGLPLTL